MDEWHVCREVEDGTKAYVRRLGSFVDAANCTAVARMGFRAARANQDICALVDELIGEGLINIDNPRRAANE